MSKHVVVAGVGMIPFKKPGASGTYVEMGAEAARMALADAGVAYDMVQQAYVGYVYGDSTCGQSALYEVGLPGIPVVNVNNNCSTGSSALFLARQAVESGAVECAIALGFEQMQSGALTSRWNDRESPLDGFNRVGGHLIADAIEAGVPRALTLFGGAGREHMQKYGTKLETFAAIRAKASRHADNNPLAIFRKVVSTDDVMNDVPVWPGVMTRLMACPPTCGAAAVIVCSEALREEARPAHRRAHPRAVDDDRRAGHLRAAFDDSPGRLRHGEEGRERSLREGRRERVGHRRVPSCTTASPTTNC